jgi:hypothetical protein
MLIGACCDASNCDDVLHYIAIYEYYCCIISSVKTATDRCVGSVAMRKVALVMNMMCPNSLNMFVITTVTLERLSRLGNCW